MTTEIIPISKIQYALREANITEQVIADLRNHLSIKVTGFDDKENYAIARKARIQCRDLRVLASRIAKAGRESAIAEQRAWIAEEKRVVGAIESIELYLEGQEKVVDDHKAKLEREAQEKIEKERIEVERLKRERIEKMYKLLNNIEVFVPYEVLQNMVDSDFDKLLQVETEKFNTRKEKEKKEKEEREAEAERLEKQRKEQQAIDEKLRIEKQKIDEEKRKIEIEKAKKEAEEIGRKKAEEEAKRVSEENARKEAEKERLVGEIVDKMNEYRMRECPMKGRMSQCTKDMCFHWTPSWQDIINLIKK